MARLLYIKANPKPSHHSLTLSLSDFFIEQYQKFYPDDTIEVLDLYHTILPIMDHERLALYNEGKETEIKRLAEQFKSFDKCVIAAPVWNHSFPAMLKIYLDNIGIHQVDFVSLWGRNALNKEQLEQQVYLLKKQMLQKVKTF